MLQQGKFDQGSDPNFLDYYERESLSSGTIGRFTRIRDRALSLLVESGRPADALDVLDIGCGAGTQSILWAEIGHRVTGLDINEPLVGLAIRRAGERNICVRFDVGSATSLPYADSSADVVLLPELLEHVADWETSLNEAVRVLRPSGLLYLSTTNWLCPRQQEFTLPGYSWYPGPLKRWCVRRALTDRPQWANHARYPAVNWFSYYKLSRWLHRHGFRTMDRFDMLSRQSLHPSAVAAIAVICRIAPVRLLAHVASEGTTVWALRD